MPHLDTVTIPNSNTMTVGPMTPKDVATGAATAAAYWNSAATLIREAFRAWNEILQNYQGQSYRAVMARSAIFATSSGAATTTRRTATRSPTPTSR